jgi:hypothetical protein
MELSKLEMLIEEMMLNGNLLLRYCLAMDDVLCQEVQLMVNIAPPKIDDKILVDKYSNISQSGLPQMQLTQWLVQEFQITIL